MKEWFHVVARNSFFAALGKLSIKLIAFGFTIVIIRWLGDEDYGKYALIWSYVVVFSMFSDIGLDLYAIRQIAKRQSDSQYIVGNILLVRIVLALFSIVLIIATIWLIGYSPRFLFQVVLASFTLLLYAVQDPLDATLQANERFDLSTLAIIAGLIAFVGTGSLLLLLGWNITGVIVARLINVIVTALLSWKFLDAYKQDLQWRINPALWPEFIRGALPFGLIKLWINWSLRIDLIILSWFWAHEIVGWYGAAHALILGIIVITTSINTALYPTLSRQYTQNPALMPNIYELAIKYLLIIALPIAGGISVLSGKTVTLLYGTEFAPTAIALAIIIWLLPLLAISEFLRYVLLVINQEKIAVQTLLFAAFLHISLGLWLIPAYSFLAAAVISVVAEVVLVLLYFHKLKAELKSINFTDALIKPCTATVILMITVIMLSPSALFLQIGSSGLVYTFILWILGVIKLNDLKQLIFSLKSDKQQPVAKLFKKQELNSAPLVSIFIPAYNAEQFLAQAIESVLAQTYPNYELIIINDGSTDRTADTLNRYQSHPKIRVHHNPNNLGMAPTWNVGLSLCRGDFVAKLDADDFYEPNYLETVIRFFQKHKEVGLVFSGLNLIYPDGRCQPEMRYLRSGVHNRDKFLPKLLQSCIIRSPTVCARRICYERLGNFIEQLRLHPDWEMWARIAANYPVGFVARRLANYRTSYGTNCTARSIVNGWSIQDLRLWLNWLENGKLPYCLTGEEEFNFRWGIYNLEMHFAAITAYHHQEGLQSMYTQFAEEVLPYQPSSMNLEEMRWAYTNFHQGLHAFRENKIRDAGYHFIQAIKPGKSRQTWHKLMLVSKITKRLVGGFSRYLLIKYCPGL